MKPLKITPRLRKMFDAFNAEVQHSIDGYWRDTRCNVCHRRQRDGKHRRCWQCRHDGLRPSDDA
jgi:hypothetical protein